MALADDHFADPHYRDPVFGFAPRFHYTLVRIAGMPPCGDPSGSGGGMMIASLDMATGKVLGSVPCLDGSTSLAVSDVTTLAGGVIRKFGPPVIGWTLGYSIWWSSRDLLGDETAALQERGRRFEQAGLSFRRTPLADRLALERWFMVKGIECSFDEEWFYGRPKLTAPNSEKSLPRDR